MADDRVAVLYDADCGFCRWSVATLLRLSRDEGLEPVAIQSEAGARMLSGIGTELWLETAHAVGPDGKLVSGGDAAPLIASRLRGGRVLARLAALSPRLTSAGYGFVARHRSSIGSLVPDSARRRADVLLDAASK